MVHVRYKVVESFDPDKDYGRNITRQVTLCLKSLTLGREFEPKEITQEYELDSSMMKNPNFLRAKCIVSEAMTIAKEIGLIDTVKTRPMPFSEFLKLETVLFQRSITWIQTKPLKISECEFFHRF